MDEYVLYMKDSRKLEISSISTCPHERLGSLLGAEGPAPQVKVGDQQFWPLQQMHMPSYICCA